MAYHEHREYPQDLPITAVRFHNMDFLAHWHSEVEFLLVLDGRQGLGVNTGYYTLQAGDMAMFCSGDIHYYDCKDSESTVLIIVFRPEMIDNLVELSMNDTVSNIIISQKEGSIAAVSEAVLAEMQTCFSAIYHELNSQKPEYKTLIKARLIELVGLFRRHQPHMVEHAAGAAMGSGHLDILQKAIRYIHDHYARDISLDDISSHLNISPFYFSRIFSKTTGLTFKNYVNSYRIEKARKLIASTNRPIIDVAFDCGFTSIRTFNRVFKQVSGRTPSSLR